MNNIKHTVKALTANITELLIYGDIGEDWWADESNDALTIVVKLATITTPIINVRINSYGGSVVDAIAIYNALKRHDATINVFIDGVAMSAASLIAMAGDTVTMASNALLMIHAPMTWSSGNSTQLRIDADMLDKYADAMANSYMSKSGKSKAEIDALLKDGQDHYYTADEALAEGFIDLISDASDLAIAAQNQASLRFTPPKNSKSFTEEFLPIFEQYIKQEKIMPPETKEKAENEAKKETVEAKNTPEKPTAAAIEAQRQNDIKAIFVHVPVDRPDIHAMLPEMLIDNSVTEAAARQKILAKMGENLAPVAKSVHVEMGLDGKDKFIQAASDAVMMRAGVAKMDTSNPMAHWNAIRIAEECVKRTGASISGDSQQIVKAAFHQTSSDFAVLLENALNKTLLAAYGVTSDTWRTFCAVGSVSDFKANTRYRTGSLSNLDNLLEGGEIKQKAIPDGEKASIQVGTKANIIAITRQTIINDDLGALLRMAQDLGRAGARTIESAVYTYLASNPTMGDGLALFHATHGNIGTTAVVTMASIDEARQLMAAQMDVSGNDYLDLRPVIWLGGLAQGGNARTVNNSQYDPDTANKLQKPNIVQGIFSNITDTPRISGNKWYAFADPSVAPVIEVAFLNGKSEPTIEMQNSWDKDGVEWKVLLDFGVAAIDYRGAVYNQGS